MERQSAALACRRLRGRHTFDVIAKVISDIHDEYDITGKVAGTTTDNGSNFVKAFSVFGKDEDEDDFFKAKSQIKTGCLESYLSSEVRDASVFDGRSAPLKELALELNIPLPASAACERLFSCGGLIMRPHRNRLTDEHFEDCLLAKLNRKFTNSV